MKIYGNIEESAVAQFQNCMKEEFVTDGALMPDAHYGYVAPIGSVIITKNIIVPSWVGYDIGCGVTAVKLKGKNLLKRVKEKRKEIYHSVNRAVPMGLGRVNPEHKISEETKKEFRKLIHDLEEKGINDDLLKWIKRKSLSHLGSLGHGNHFIEIDYTGKEVWLIIHSGSRNTGHKIAGYYMQKAMQDYGEKGEKEKTYGLKANSKLGKEYLATLEFGLELALLNRREIIKTVMKEINYYLPETKYEIWTNKNHNHAERVDKETFIHRKGATPSKKRERGVIPGNMRDGTFLVIGKGNKNYLESSSHGAGRAMSKRQTKKETTMEKFKETMKGITATIEKGTLDESPFAYKNIKEVMKEQEKSVKIYKHLKPIINWKGKGR